MKFIILTALSPRFNTIGTLRIEKLAKYLSTNVDVQIIAGMPLLPEDSPFLRRKVDIGSAKLIEIPVRRMTNPDEVTLITRDMIIVFLVGSIGISLNNARMFWFFLGILTSIRRTPEPRNTV